MFTSSLSCCTARKEDDLQHLQSQLVWTRHGPSSQWCWLTSADTMGQLTWVKHVLSQGFNPPHVPTICLDPGQSQVKQYIPEAPLHSSPLVFTSISCLFVPSTAHTVVGANFFAHCRYANMLTI